MSRLQAPKAEGRERTVWRAGQLAEGHGLRAHLCGCVNPDISKERCFLAGERHARAEEATQKMPFRE